MPALAPVRDCKHIVRMPLPPDHPQRVELNDEVHARPPEALVAPLRLSFLAIFADAALRDQEWQHVCSLVQRYGAASPPRGANHLSVDLGPFRLKWERHTEFSRYKFIVTGGADDPFAPPAIAAVPSDWISGLSGQVMVAAHAALVRGGHAMLDHEALSGRLFGGNVPVGSTIAGGAAVALTDFRIKEDGFSRFYVIDRGMTPRQAGRMVQRLMEIDTYRVMALLALPIAHQLGPFLNQSERELAQITAALSTAEETDEALLLDRLTQLEAQIQSRESQHAYRFAAAAAYYELVQRRIAELREDRIQGLQTFREFTERRLAPAMNTCQSVARRQGGLSERVARVTQLLSTRVDITRERQNQAVLESMNRRARLQLRLQETVEGLSVAAVTYYIVGLVGYLAKGLKAAGVAVNPDVTMAISIPVVAVLAALGVRSIRKAVRRNEA
jgi:uncharacterized membrane-anchored protein